MSSAILSFAALAAGIFSEGAPAGSDTVQNLTDGPALLLYLGLIFLVGVLLIWNARSYQAPELAHGGHEAHDGHSAVHEQRLQEEEEIEEAGAVPARDDLKIIEGIGPVTEKVFFAAGIFTFAQLAATPAEKLNEILDAAGLRLGDPTTWPDQARLAAEGDWDGFQQLTDRLKGGRLS